MHKVLRHQRLPKITQHQKNATRPQDDSDQAGKEIDVVSVSPQSTTESEQARYQVSMLVGRSWDMRGEGREKWWRTYIEEEEEEDDGGNVDDAAATEEDDDGDDDDSSDGDDDDEEDKRENAMRQSLCV